MSQLYQCPNFEYCSKARNYERQNTDECEECHTETNRMQERSGMSPAVLIAAGVLGVVGLLGGGWLLLKGGGEQTEEPAQTAVVSHQTAPVPPKVEQAPPVEKPVDTEKELAPTPPQETSPKEELSSEVKERARQGFMYLSMAMQIKEPAGRTRQMENAYHELSEAITLAEQQGTCSAAAYRNRGQVNRELKKPNLALEDLQKSVECDPKDPLAHYNLAAYYSANKQVDLAMRAFESALDAGLMQSLLNSKVDACKQITSDKDLTALVKTTDFKLATQKRGIFCVK